MAAGQPGDEVRRRGPAQPAVAAGGGRGGSDDLGAVEVSCPGGQSHTWVRGRDQNQKSLPWAKSVYLSRRNRKKKNGNLQRK